MTCRGRTAFLAAVSAAKEPGSAPDLISMLDGHHPGSACVADNRR
jgi:hypothetical protein